jgi:hypothetical protein
MNHQILRAKRAEKSHCAASLESCFQNDSGEKRMQKKVFVERSVSLHDIGLNEPVGTERAVLSFLHWAEAVATRWIQMPAGVLLCVAVPGDLHSGACYLYERREGLFHCLDVPGAANGQLTSEEFDCLVRQFRLMDLARRPRKLSGKAAGKTHASDAFASAA